LKKIGAILFLLILVFNFCGYKWVLSYMEKKATARLEKKLEAGKYDRSDLVEVKIPLNLPYYTDWADYETFYGEAEFQGKVYQYVKRKISADTLYLLCVPHTEKNDIQIAKSDYFKGVNNLQHDGMPQKGNQSSPIKLMLSEFLQNDILAYDLNSDNIPLSLSSCEISYSSQFNPPTPAQPPEC
jgi:hypothetical protein